MKKLLSCFAVLLVCVMLFCACSFQLGLTGEAEPHIKEMITALAAEDMGSAKALLHPKRLNDGTDEALAALAGLLNGRKLEAYVQVSINVTNSVGTGGTARTETGTVQLTFDDGTGLYLNYTYFSDKDGEGFQTFQFLVGVQ